MSREHDSKMGLISREVRQAIILSSVFLTLASLGWISNHVSFTPPPDHQTIATCIDRDRNQQCDTHDWPVQGINVKIYGPEIISHIDQTNQLGILTLPLGANYDIDFKVPSSYPYYLGPSGSYIDRQRQIISITYDVLGTVTP